MSVKDRERKRLREYERRLSAAEGKLAELSEVQRDVKGLRQIVAGLRVVVGEEPPANDTPPRSQQEHKATRTGSRGGKLMPFLRRLYADGQRHTIESVMEALGVSGEFGSDVPPRGTVRNRHFDLKNEGYIHQVARGTYVLASQNGSASGVRADETNPSLPVDGIPSPEAGRESPREPPRRNSRGTRHNPRSGPLARAGAS